jgi:hypothetical protein
LRELLGESSSSRSLAVLMARYVKLFALRTVPAGAVVFVTVIGPLVTPAGTVAFSWVEET